MRLLSPLPLVPMGQLMPPLLMQLWLNLNVVLLLRVKAFLRCIPVHVIRLRWMLLRMHILLFVRHSKKLVKILRV